MFANMTGTHSCVMSEANVTRPNLLLILATATALIALALSAARARDVPKVATGFVANILCSETFVSGQQPDRIFRETTAAMPGVHRLTGVVRTIDNANTARTSGALPKARCVWKFSNASGDENCHSSPRADSTRMRFGLPDAAYG